MSYDKRYLTELNKVNEGLGRIASRQAGQVACPALVHMCRALRSSVLAGVQKVCPLHSTSNLPLHYWLNNVTSRPRMQPHPLGHGFIQFPPSSYREVGCMAALPSRYSITRCRYCQKSIRLAGSWKQSWS